MGHRSAVATVGESFFVGAAVSAGLLAVVLKTPLGSALSPLGDLVVFGWLAVISLGSFCVGLWRSVPTADLLGGGILGMMIGWLGFRVVIGVDYVLLIIALMGAGGWVVGTVLVSLWRHRVRGE